MGFDIKRHIYGDEQYPAQLVLQDALTIHGRQFKNAHMLVMSPPCQEYSYMAMPWSKAKAIAEEYRSGVRDVKKLTALFDACFRIQREACEATGRHIPLVVENVRGAQKWVGRAQWHFGSYYLWGDVPALMPMTKQYKSHGMNWSDRSKCGQDFTRIAGEQAIKAGKANTDPKRMQDWGRKGIPHRPSGHWANPEESGTKQGGDWFNNSQPSISRLTSSKSTAREAASAMIARIPAVLARHIARAWKPRETPE